MLVHMVCTNVILGQIKECGTIANAHDYEAYERKVASMVNPSINGNNRDNIYLAMRVVVFTSSTGATSVDEDELELSIENAKKTYAKQGIIISSCAPIFTPNNSLYKFEKLTETPQLEALVSDNLINVFVTEELASNDVDICGFATFPYSEGKKYVVVNSLCINNPSTLIHEMGHYFGLYHTHETFYGREFVSRFNCTESGDLLCDTPADPQLSGLNVNNACTYVGVKVDALGEYYKPDTRNFMSYSLKTCRDVFSPQQQAVTRSVAIEHFNSYLKACSGNDISIFSDFQFDKSIVSGYLVTVPFELRSNKFDRDFDYKIRASIVHADGTVTVLKESQYSSTRYSFNDSLMVRIPSKTNSGDYDLKLEIVLPQDIQEVNTVDNAVNLPLKIDYTHLVERKVFYNASNQEIHLYVKNMPLSYLTITIYDLSGRVVMKTEDFQAKTGEYVNVVSAPILVSGIYAVVVDNGKEQHAGKIYVQ